MFTSRKSYATIEDNRINLNNFYQSNSSSQEYSTFRQRVRGVEERGMLTYKSLDDALTLSPEDWISWYGGGKRKPFRYSGEKYPEYKNTTFPSLSAFLKTIGMYNYYGRIKARLGQLGWAIDDALNPIAVDNSIGRIYCIFSSQTNLKYIGQTSSPINVRFLQHKNDYEKCIAKKEKAQLRPLHNAFQCFGVVSFSIKLIEDNIPKERLTERENYWMTKYDTIKNGLNAILGVNASGGRKVPVVYQGKRFSSHKNATRTISKETGVPEHNVERAIRKNEPLKESYRKESDHPDAKKSVGIANNLWRRWKGLKKRNRLCAEWSDDHEYCGYNEFKEIVGFPPSNSHNLYPTEFTKKLSSENFQWLTKEEWVPLLHGIEITIKGVKYSSLSEVSKKFSIPLSTLSNRLNAQGMHLDEILEQPKKSTKRKPTEYDNQQFASEAEMDRYISKTYNITEGQARDRRVRGLPFDKPSHAKPCNVGGQFFKSENEAARHFGIKKPTFTKRKQLGWTLEEALGLVARAKS